jgi:acetyl esterase/lipase
MWLLSTALTLAIASPIAAPSPLQPIDLWPGAAPGSQTWTQKEIAEKNTPIGTVVIDVVTPTLTAYLPDPAKATGAGIIVAPGGAFVALAMDLEGNEVARRLQKRGIAAFVLKYRTIEKHGPGIPADLDIDKASQYGIADGLQAVKVVRQHAAQWVIAPDQIGFLGFSAGAMVASAALLSTNVDARPNFGALIYGAPFGALPAVPPKLPPMFMAWAQDDALAPSMAKFYDALRSAGNKPEVHVYSSGGHGFGVRKHDTTSDLWVDEFYDWLEAGGFLKPVVRTR